MRTVRFELLRPDEIIAEREHCPLVFQPIGPLEWHGPHLPYGVDPLHAEAVARRVAETVGGVVIPTLYWGTERERSPEMLKALGFKGDEWIVGMDFPANSMKSLYSQEDIFGLVVRARLELLVSQQYKLIVLVNGHGAQNHLETLTRLAAEFSAVTPAHVLLITAFAPDADGRYNIGHADALETSLMLSLYPETVQVNELPPLPDPLRNIDWGIVNGTTFAGHPTSDFTLAPEDDPRRNEFTSAERGAQVLAQTVAWIGEQVQKALASLTW